jgi:hypothetical protein
MQIYFGPIRDVPSWPWVGRDVAEFLSAEHTIRYFNDLTDIDDDSLVFWVKCPLRNQEAAAVLEKKLRIVFFPVDVFLGYDHIAECSDFIDACRLIVLHSRSMARLFPGRKIRFVDHYNKYGVSHQERQPNGSLVWIGAYQYFPYIVRYMLENGLHGKRNIISLTNFNSPAAIVAANQLSQSLDLGIDFGHLRDLSDFSIIEWSERSQRELLLTCSGAFDYKDDLDFNQIHKPPTKLQKFLCSHIPCAINGSSPLRSILGFDLCDILDFDTWFSGDYQNLVSRHGVALSRRLRLENIARKYVEFAEEVTPITMESAMLEDNCDYGLYLCDE